MFFPGQHGLNEASIRTENIGKICSFFLPVLKNLKYFEKLKLYRICINLFIYFLKVFMSPTCFHSLKSQERSSRGSKLYIQTYNHYVRNDLEGLV